MGISCPPRQSSSSNEALLWSLDRAHSSPQMFRGGKDGPRDLTRLRRLEQAKSHLAKSSPKAAEVPEMPQSCAPLNKILWGFSLIHHHVCNGGRSLCTKYTNKGVWFFVLPVSFLRRRRQRVAAGGATNSLLPAPQGRRLLTPTHLAVPVGSCLFSPELRGAGGVCLCSVLFGLGGVILPLARVPQQQRDADGGQGHHAESRPVQLGEIFTKSQTKSHTDESYNH